MRKWASDFGGFDMQKSDWRGSYEDPLGYFGTVLALLFEDRGKVLNGARRGVAARSRLDL